MGMKEVISYKRKIVYDTKLPKQVNNELYHRIFVRVHPLQQFNPWNIKWELQVIFSFIDYENVD